MPASSSSAWWPVRPGASSASLYYLFAYMIMSVGSFAVVTVLGRQGDADHDLSRYRGLAGRQPVLALAFAVLLLAQAGAPFTTGLWAKVQVVFAAVDAGYVPLGAIAMVTAVVAAYFYLRVAVLMYAGGGLGEAEGGAGGSSALGAGDAMVGGSTIELTAPAGSAEGRGRPGSSEPAGNGGFEWATPAAVAGSVTTLNEQILLDDEATGASEPTPDRVPVPVLTSRGHRALHGRDRPLRRVAPAADRLRPPGDALVPAALSRAGLTEAEPRPAGQAVGISWVMTVASVMSMTLSRLAAISSGLTPSVPVMP